MTQATPTRIDTGLTTPIYLKTSDQMPMPDDPVFYLLAGNGLFLCRNHEFFASSVPAPQHPCELADHQPRLVSRYPKLPRRYLELAVGFFYQVYKRHGSEAGLLLIWDRTRNRMQLHCPPQTAGVYKTWNGRAIPLNLHYDMPELQPHQVLIGDIHSHADEAAYTSVTDQHDANARGGGMHIVIGRLGNIEFGRPPQIHIDIFADGKRFQARPELVLEGFSKPRQNVPDEWFDCLKVDGGTTTTAVTGATGYGTQS